jgi:transcriptional regulator with XRE-family HTH domain
MARKLSMWRGVKIGLAFSYAPCKFTGMTLDAYLRTHAVTGSEMAARLGISAASVTRIRKGGQNITLQMAQRIVTATGGKVTLEDLATQAVA